MNNKVQHYFFALWPDDALQKQYAKFSQQYLNGFKGKFVPTQNIHITLAFLGELNKEQIKSAKLAADGIKTDSFVLQLDHIGFWKKPQVIWLAPSKTPKPLTELATALQSKLKERKFNVDERPFKPHLTLMRKAHKRPGALQFNPCEWRVERFVLVRSTLEETGAIYDIIHEWPLT